MVERVCVKCYERKPLSEFVSTKSSTKYVSTCLACRAQITELRRARVAREVRDEDGKTQKQLETMKREASMSEVTGFWQGWCLEKLDAKE
jgi:cytidine deaminase